MHSTHSKATTMFGDKVDKPVAIIVHNFYSQSSMMMMMMEVNPCLTGRLARILDKCSRMIE
jgi:hypothetical protein